MTKKCDACLVCCNNAFLTHACAKCYRNKNQDGHVDCDINDPCCFVCDKFGFGGIKDIKESE